MYTPDARPLPKRTRSTAGLEDFDVWLSQLPGGSQHQHAHQHAHAQPQPLPDALMAGHQPPTARKRHHSLPSTTLAGSLMRPMTLGFHPPITEASRNASVDASPSSFPHANASFSAQVYPRSSSSSQYSSSTHHHPGHSYSDATSIASSLQPPEMSPREDYLVRAFVSDAMKLEGEDRFMDTVNSQPIPNFRPSQLDTASRDFDASSTCSSNTTTTPTASQHSGPSKWTREEDDRLRDAVARFGGKNWKMIAESMGNGRTDVQCLHRWNKVLKPGLVKGPWTPEEDRILLSLIARYGVGKIRWCDVALHLPGRIGKQCRERWCNHLDSSIRKGQWTPEEDETVFRWQQKLGNKWSEIAKMLPGRTENAVKNRFNSAARRKWLMNQAAARGVSALTPTTKAPSAEGTEHSTPDAISPPSRTSLPSTSTHASPSPFPFTTGIRSNELLPSDLLAGPPRLQPHVPLHGSSYQTPRLDHQPPQVTVSSFVSLDSESVHDSPSTMFPFVGGEASSFPREAPAYHEYSPPSHVHERPLPTFSAHTSPFRPQSFSLPPLAESPSQNQYTSAHEVDRLSILRGAELDDIDANNQDDDHGSEGGYSDAATASSKQSTYSSSKAPGEPQTDSDVDRGDESATGERSGSNSPGESAVMDDQNMSTFLDSVALELDDIL